MPGNENRRLQTAPLVVCLERTGIGARDDATARHTA
jgi:hypothetical protein